MKLFDVNKKVILITGASSGIGKEIALFFASQGANIALVARRKEKLMNLKDSIEEEYKVKCIAIGCDVTVEKEVVEMVNIVISEFGKIDVLINDAGTTEKSEDVAMHTDTQWNKVINTNLTSVYRICREVVPHMKKQSKGKIINISSICGIMGLANQVSYAASKSGVIGLTKALAVELGKYNINVNSIAPGYIETEMTNLGSRGYEYFKSRTVLGRIGKVEDLRGIALLLASDASNYITGAVMVVDGGITASV